MKKTVSIVVLLLVVLAFLMPAYAAGVLIADNAGLFSDAELQNLEVAASEESQRAGLDILIVTVDSLEGIPAYTYARDYYIANGFRDDGVLILLAMEEREWYILTSGRAENILTDSKLDALGDEILPYLSAGRYYQGFEAYITLLDSYLGNSMPTYPDPDIQAALPNDFGRIIGISLLIGAAAGGVVLAVMRSGMNTKRSNNSAGNYMNDRTYNLRIHQDMYLYSNVTKTPKPKSSSSGSHTGGRSFGGRGGKF